MPAIAKVDLTKDLKELYRPSGREPSVVDVPAMNFLMLDGSGDPGNSEEFQDACSALYGMSYALKFILKKEGRTDYKVMPLEGLWWMKGTRNFDAGKRDEWQWRLLIAQPGEVTAADVKAATAQLRRKKNPVALPKVRFRSFAEGKAVQIMYTGPYSEEGPTIQMLRRFAAESGFKLTGKHHEIYMGDPRRSAPEKLKTIIRQPVK